MTRLARVALQTGPRSIELGALPVPDEVGPAEALLRVEGSGMCGTDYEQYVGAMAASGLIDRYPVVPGHEPVGRIELIGPEASRAWGVAVGDRVAIEPGVEGGFIYAYAPTDISPGLWGGYAEYMYLRSGTKVHRLPDELSVEDAVLFNPLAAGFEWVNAAGVCAGDRVLVLGPGQRGLACVVALKEAGADQILVSGLARDQAKLSLARDLGATHTLVADGADVAAWASEVTEGRGVDRAIDVTPFATQPILDAVASVRRGATIVLAGIKGGREVTGFVSDDVVFKGLTLRGVLGSSGSAMERAIDVIASHRYPLERLHTHTLPMADLDLAMRILGGEVPGEDAIHITIVPSLS